MECKSNWTAGRAHRPLRGSDARRCAGRCAEQPRAQHRASARNAGLADRCSHPLLGLTGPVGARIVGPTAVRPHRHSAGVSSAALAAAAAAPPTPRNCAQINSANPSYVSTNATHWNTDGTEDNGQILNQIGSWARTLQGNLDDLQVRLAQLACENQNIKDKLDYLIRRTQP